MVYRPIWLQVMPGRDGKGILCIGCTENRLGRRLTPEDFKPTGSMSNNPDRMSDRMRSRMGL